MARVTSSMVAAMMFCLLSVAWPGNASAAVYASTNSTSAIVITWDASTSLFFSKYELYVNTENSKPATPYWTTSVKSTTTYNYIAAQPGVNYYIWLTYSYTVGGSTETTAGYRKLAMPVVSATDGTSPSAVTLSGYAVTGGANYRLYRAATSTRPASPWATTAATSYADATATPPGTTWYYWVEAIGANGAPSAASAPDSGYIKLLTPVVSATDGASTSAVTLSYAPVNGAISYRILRTTTPSFTSPQLLTTTPNTSFADTTATPGTTYYYWIEAVGSNGFYSAVSAPDSGYIKLATPVVSATNGASTSAVTLSGYAVPGAINYRILKTTTPSFTSPQLLTTTPNTSYADTTAMPGVTCYYWVEAVGSNGFYSTVSATVSGYIRLATPVVSATDGTSTSAVTISYPPVNGAIIYRIYRSTTATFADAQLLPTTSNTSYFDTIVMPGATCYYWVEAVGSNGFYSAVSTPDSGYIKLATPVVSATDGTSTSAVTLSGYTVPGAISYRISRNTTNSFSSAQLLTTTLNTSYADTTAMLGTTCYYWVEAVGSNGSYSAVSAQDSGYIKLATPVVSATDGTSASAVTISYPPVPGATGYRISRTTTPSFTGVQWLTTTPGTTYADATAIPGSTFYYWVEAVGNNGFYSAVSAEESGYVKLSTPVASATDGTFTDRIVISVDAVPYAASYRISRNTTSIFAGAQLLGTTSSTSYPDMTAVPGLIYYYFAQAVGQNSLPSDPSAASPGLCAISDLALTATSGKHPDRVELSWDAVPGALTYEIYRHTEATPQTAPIQTLPAGTTSYLDSAVTPDTLYYYWLKAIPASVPEAKTSAAVTGYSSLHKPMAGLGKALSFNGIDDFVTLPAVDLSAGNTMTIEAWVKPDDITTNADHAILQQGTDANPDWLLSFQGNGTLLAFGTRTTDGYDELDISIDPATYMDGAWHHLAATYDGTTKRLYVDGNEIGSGTWSGILTASGLNQAIGASWSGATPGDLFSGRIDDVRLWNVVRDGAEIAAGRWLPLKGVEAALAGYWPFEEGLGRSTLDRSRSTGDGQISGRAVFVDSLVVYPRTTSEETPLVLTLGGFDPSNDGDSQVSTVIPFIATLPVHGLLYQTSDGTTAELAITEVPASVSDVQGRVIYVPDANVAEPDSFTYGVNDGSYDSVNNVTVSIAITPVNDPPVIVGQEILSTVENSPLALALANLNVTDPDNNYPAGFTLSVGSGDNYTVSGTTITPATGFFGTLSVPVTVNDGAADSEIYPLVVTILGDSDGDGVADTADNCLSVANSDQNDANGNSIGDACDPADSDGDGFSDETEVAAGSDPGVPTSVPVLAVAVLPASMPTDFNRGVRLILAPVVPADTVMVEQILDVDNDGVVDADEPALRSFNVTDGAASVNPNVPGDDDGMVNGTIRVGLILSDALDIHHLPGNFLFWVSDGNRTDTAAFAVTVTLGSQSVSGTVTDGANPVPGALVTLQGQGFAATPYGAFANELGEYHIEVPTSGNYHVIAEDYAGQLVTAEADGNALVPVGAGQHVTGIDRTLTTGTVAISGNAGAPGVKVVAESATAHGQVLANADGSYQLSVPAGSYQIQVSPTDHLGLHPSSKGLVGQEGYRQTVDATSNVSGIDFTLAPATVNVSGTVRDEFGVALVGMAVEALNTTDPTLPVAMALTGVGGSYTLGLSAVNPWTLTVMGDKLWPQNLLSSQINDYSTATSPATGNNLTIYEANAWIAGTVRNAQGQPMSKVQVSGCNGDSSLCTGGLTDADGSYRLPARGDMVWTVDALTEEAGQEPVSAQTTSLLVKQTATLDFTAPLPTVVAPASITVPASDSDGSYMVSWGASATAGVTYYLQEATDAAFTQNVRWAYSGTGVSAGISGRASGKTFYYRVRAQKPGNTASSYRTAGNGCAVMLPCAVPASLSVPATSATGSYSVSWGASTTAGVTYYLQEATDAAFTQNVRWAYSGTSTSAGISGRATGKTFYYRVRAQKAGYTASAYRTTGNSCAVMLPCGVPASLSVPATSATGSYTVSWGASTTAGVTYYLQEATDAAFTQNVRWAYSGTSTSAGISGRASGKTFYYRVRAQRVNYTASAYQTAGNGCAVMLPCAVPASLSVPATSVTGSYPVSWGASATAGVTYYLQEATDAAFTQNVRWAYSGTGVSAGISGRASGKTFYYRVRAQKAGYTASAYQTAGNGCVVGP